MSERPRVAGSRLAQAGLAMAVLALLLLIFSGLGTRSGWWHFRTGFSMLRYAAYLGLATALVGAVAAWLTRPTPGRTSWVGWFALAILAAVLGLTAFVVPWRWQRIARAAPPIHDISTDTQNPPAFVSVLPQRADAPNPPEYAGPETAAQQRSAYPDIQPLLLLMPPQQAFQLALDVAVALDWHVVEADAAAGRIEATDRTRWFGFYDDVVIRVTPVDADRSVVDVRSKSRIGRGDAGENARRVRGFLDRMRE